LTNGKGTFRGVVFFLEQRFLNFQMKEEMKCCRKEQQANQSGETDLDMYNKGGQETDDEPTNHDALRD
jgi:hypothetical protein